MMKNRKVIFWLLALFVVVLLLGGFTWRHLHTPRLPVTETILSERVTPVDYQLWNLALGGTGTVYGSRARELYRVVNKGEAIEKLHTFDDPISGIFERKDGLMLVATDAGRWDMAKPCRIFLSKDGGQHFRHVKTLEKAVALWWSFSADSEGRLFMGEYGPQKKGMSKNVWRSSDDGESWEVIFTAEDIDKVHIHRVAVDPHTQDVWLTIGDGSNRQMWRSTDHGDNWTQIGRYQATAVAFTEDAIYWGRDSSKAPGVLRYDRQSGKFKQVLHARLEGNYGGSIYDMALGADQALYLPMMKYADQDHIAALWRLEIGENGESAPILWLKSEPGKGMAQETIAGPDADGFLYFTGYKIVTR